MRRELLPKSEGAGDWVSASDPMSSMGNLMDVMLVFACGLIIALSAYWNLDLNEAANQEDNLNVIDGSVQENVTLSDEGVDALDKVGIAYKDPVTGDYYISEGE